ncbi:hypothetical protein [Collimonas humicola]|uniref:hypothetical protein n=1 Tax=Collimonas humicola TaxID=2825886 RepID=UPI001B8D1F17|nr:hypothetical protein [Collimonas humicola]
MFQISRIKKIVACLFWLLLFSHATAVRCENRFYVIWRDFGLSDAARLVSQYSGRSIRLAPEVRGTVNLASTDPLSPDEIFFQFQKALRERGLRLVRLDGNEYRIETTNSSAVSNQAATPRTPEIVTSESAKTLVALAKSACSLEAPVGRHRYVGAVFAFEQRAQAIASRLCAAGAEAIVLASNDPTDTGFSVVLLYRDSREDYRAMISAVEQAGLNDLISTPALSAEFSMQEGSAGDVKDK